MRILDKIEMRYVYESVEKLNNYINRNLKN